LKYAARRAADKSDLQELGNTLPALLMPWAEKLDREWVVSIEKKNEDGSLVLRLARRWSEQHNYMLVYLDGEKGPVSKIEVFEQRMNNRNPYAFLARTVTCEEIKEVGGVKVPTVFKTTLHSDKPVGGKAVDPKQAEAFKKEIEVLRASGKVEEVEALMRKLGTVSGEGAGDASTVASVVRLSDLKVNYKPEAENFKIELPKDWAVRNLDVAPRGTDVKPVSGIVNPSPNTGGPMPRGGFRGE
jgi:hypothetical protein